MIESTKWAVDKAEKACVDSMENGNGAYQDRSKKQIAIEVAKLRAVMASIDATLTALAEHKFNG